MNPLDQKYRDFGAFNIGASLPAIIAADIVGEIVGYGASVSQSEFPLGAHVFGQPAQREAQGLQQYTIVDSRHAAPVPSGISDDEAAVFPVNAVTSCLALFSPCGFGWPFPGTEEARDFDYKSLSMAVVGAGSNCGKIAVQFASLAGVGTIIAVASLSGEAELKGYGATHVIDRKAVDIEAQVRGIVGDELLFVYDGFGAGHTLSVSLLSNKKKGTFVHVLSGKVDEAVIAKKAAGYEDKPNLVGYSPMWPEFARHYWRAFPKWLESGKIKAMGFEIIQGLDAEKINGVLDEYKNGGGERYHVHVQG